MDRLTNNLGFKSPSICCRSCTCGCCTPALAWERLKAIEDILGDSYELEELRRVMGYRSLIGKTVYGIRKRDKSYRTGKYYDFWITNRDAVTRRPEVCYVGEKKCTKSDLNRLGATVFLTREEAEEAIGGGRNG